jgi:glutamate racemase
VGVFDSGVGGLTVVASLIEHKTFDEIIYFGDTARVPYGTKDQNTIVRYGLEAVEFFNNFDIDLLITACNTVSAYALSAMREKSSYPIYGVVTPGILALKRKLSKKSAKILVIGTKATINSKRYQNELESFGYRNITAIQTGMLVPIVEEGILNGEVLNAMLKYYFKNIFSPPDAIILGCTHFPLIADAIRDYFDNSPLIIHSGEAIVEYLESKNKIEFSNNQTVKIFASDNVDGLRTIAKSWLRR